MLPPLRLWPKSLTPAVSRRAMYGIRMPQSSHWRGRLQCVVRASRVWDVRLRGTLGQPPPRADRRRRRVPCTATVAHSASWPWGRVAHEAAPARRPRTLAGHRQPRASRVVADARSAAMASRARLLRTR